MEVSERNSQVQSFHAVHCRVEHQRMHEKHRGHEAMHAEMVLILIVTLVVAQIVLVQWKQRHFRSYQVSCLISLTVSALLSASQSLELEFKMIVSN